MTKMILHLSRWKKHARWHAVLQWSLLDAMGLLAVAATVLPIGLWGAVILPLRHDVTQLAQLDARLVWHPVKKVATRAASHSDDLSQEFIAFLPALDTREQQLLQLHKLAVQHALTINRIDYQYQTLSTLPIERMSLRLSLQGSYVAQRKMLHDLLAMLPNLCVDKMSLEKLADKPDTLSQRMELSFYYQSSSVARQGR